MRKHESVLAPHRGPDFEKSWAEHGGRRDVALLGFRPTVDSQMRQELTYLLTHDVFVQRYGQRFTAACTRAGRRLEMLLLPPGAEDRLGDPMLRAIEMACFIGVWEADFDFTRRFLGSTLRAPNLKWLHLPNVGVDHPVFTQLLQQGVRLTNSSGASAEPIAQTAIAGVLALARGFPAWWAAQQRHEWAPHAQPPQDLRGQTMVVVGLGAIGNEIARLAQVLGLNVVGVRRSPRQAEDRVDELVPPTALPSVVTRADWLVLACPLTEETRGMIDARILASLAAGARVINVARGQVIDEAALISLLRNKHLGGAYLDVFEEEPLPASSPLWDLPNVIVSPHNSASSTGHSHRVAEIFFDNLERWFQGAALRNEVRL